MDEIYHVPFQSLRRVNGGEHQPVFVLDRRPSEVTRRSRWIQNKFSQELPACFVSGSKDSQIGDVVAPRFWILIKTLQQGSVKLRDGFYLGRHAAVAHAIQPHDQTC